MPASCYEPTPAEYIHSSHSYTAYTGLSFLLQNTHRFMAIQIVQSTIK